MLRELHIKNFSIIDDVTVEFGEGFNVLTGETGAGKSIIIDALCLALGQRATAGSIRSGEKEAVVEAFFDIPQKIRTPFVNQFIQDNGIEAEDGFILKRSISSQGKNRAYINGSMANVQSLSDMTKNIIDVHGQFEHQSLLSSDRQRDLLDAFGGLLEERREVRAVYEDLTALRRQTEELVQREKERAQRIDMLKFQINEIGPADLHPGEEEEIADEIKILSSAVRLAELANDAYDSLYSSDSACIAKLARILSSMREISNIDARAIDALKSAESAHALLEDAAYFLRDYKERLDFNPERLEQAQERLELIKGMKRKYGGSVQEILDYKDKAVVELGDLQHSEERLETLGKEVGELKVRLTEKAQGLSRKRKAAAKKIEAAVVAHLSELAMPDTRFSILITQEKGDDTVDGFRAGPCGTDSIGFLISPNIGEELRPLSKIASGGELSRIMLALKSIMAGGDEIPVLVFDEIDAGVGGRTAENVGRKLKGLSSGHQVICITHLPQIASYADTHLRIEKRTEKDRTVVEINALGKDERSAEIARMLGGEISEVSLRHAKEMLKKSSAETVRPAGGHSEK
ncbi:MAG: DNA repair protein RecN [Nitrospiraceae bacterium]|nr:MAG: DNA repair protein RecN [Nitrospiraceae bacterium]